MRLKNRLEYVQNSLPYKIWQFLSSIRKAILSKRFKTQNVANTKWPQNLPLISVIIPCFNYGGYITETIASIRNQTFQRFEIIVIDDGSTDPATLNILHELKDVNIIHQSNCGLPAARNRGIMSAKGKYVCCLDADDLLEPTYFEKCLLQLESKNLDICYSYFEQFGESQVKCTRPNFFLTSLIFSNCAIVPAIYKKSLWERVHGYDEIMRDGYEDWEFYIRCAKNGAVGGVIPEYLFKYRVHSDSMLFQSKKRHLEILEYIHKKHADLFGNLQKQIELENNQKIKYIVSDPLINL
ncbi:MAG: glycosyltransferase [Oligoflexia bacterium]|nr:glycosyltransferase [Oligoflexia bacterium]